MDDRPSTSWPAGGGSRAVGRQSLLHYLVACLLRFRMTAMTNQWNAAEYDAKHAFVYEKAKGLVELLAPKAGERILDLGCGTGALTAEIVARGAEVLGVDRSEEMIAQARKKFPALRFEVMDARQLRFETDAAQDEAAGKTEKQIPHPTKPVGIRRDR